MTCNNAYEESLKEIKEIYPGKLMLTKKEVAALTSRSPSALDKDRESGVGIPFKKLPGKVLYSIFDVSLWINSKVQTA